MISSSWYGKVENDQESFSQIQITHFITSLECAAGKELDYQQDLIWSHTYPPPTAKRGRQCQLVSEWDALFLCVLK